MFSKQKGTQDKFAPKSSEGIFTRHSQRSKVYRVFINSTQTIIESLYVEFDEHIDQPTQEEIEVPIETPSIFEKSENPIENPLPIEEAKNHIEPITEIEIQPVRHLRNPHSIDQIIGDKEIGIQTRPSVYSNMDFGCHVSQIEPKKIDEALKDNHWLIAMQKSLTSSSKMMFGT